MKKALSDFIKQNNLSSLYDLECLINKMGNSIDSRLVYSAAEYLNPNRFSNAGYYTDSIICDEIFRYLPTSNADYIKILEPSVGAGIFLPYIAEHFKNAKKVDLYIVDIDLGVLNLAELIFKVYYLDKYPNINIKRIHGDYLLHNFKNKYFDFIIGNPPYQKLTYKDGKYKLYLNNSSLKNVNNTFEFFIEKAIHDGNFVSLIIPKTMLSAPNCSQIRNLVKTYSIPAILDFGELGFAGVKIETINIFIDTKNAFDDVFVKSLTLSTSCTQKKNYVTDQSFPSWIIYRNQFFDNYSSKLQLGIFSCFRDRQISSKKCLSSGAIRVLRSQNICTNRIIDIPHYDMYLDDISDFAVKKFLNKENIVCVPNLSYYPRACLLPLNCIADGSVALLESNIKINESDLAIFETSDFRKYYQIARNYGTRSLNIDKNSVYYFGIERQLNER